MTWPLFLRSYRCREGSQYPAESLGAAGKQNTLWHILLSDEAFQHQRVVEGQRPRPTSFNITILAVELFGSFWITNVDIGFIYSWD